MNASATEPRSFWQRLTRRKVSAHTKDKTQDTTRLLESFLATGCLYGIDVENNDPAWFRRC